MKQEDKTDAHGATTDGRGDDALQTPRVGRLRSVLTQLLSLALFTLLLTIGCDCFLRRLEIENDGGVESVATLLRQQRVIGFNTYGEQFNGMHINQTFTGVAIGRPVGRAER